MGNPEERRTDMHRLSQDIGYIKGSMDSLHEKVDVAKNVSKANTTRIGVLEKRADKYRNIAAGATGTVTALTWLAIKWQAVQDFFTGAGNA